MTKSLIVTQITACDYPIWRAWLKKYGSFFDSIHIYFDVQFRHPFYWAFIQSTLSQLPNVYFLDPVPYEYGVGDWRNTSTNALIKDTNSDWLISIEQDWFAQDWDKLIDSMQKSMDNYDMFGWWNESQNPYVHPAFWGIKRELLNRTRKDFSAHSEIIGADHFAMITYDALELDAKIDKYTGEVKPDSPHFHLGGVNQNYLNFDQLFEANSLHREEQFYVYNYWSMRTDVAQNVFFTNTMQDVDKKLKTRYPNVNPETSDWAKFFRI